MRRFVSSRTAPLLLVMAASVAMAAPERATQLGSRDFADPFVLREPEAYYAFATGAAGAHVQAARSSDLVAWSVLPDALPKLPGWAAQGPGLTWAPSVLRRPAGYVLYYVARDAASGFQCISRATSAAVAGPYVDDSSRAFVCDVSGDRSFCGSIDPSPFVDSSGRPYLLWKSDENSASCGRPPRIWSQPLTDDGLGLLDVPTALLATDRAWEGPIIEGPSMLEHGGAYFLFYSANAYESARYAIGYATCSSPRGPCIKATTERPFVASANTLRGPGGQEFFADATGDIWMAFHAWTAPRTTYAEGGARSLRFARVRFAGDAPTSSSATSSRWAR